MEALDVVVIIIGLLCVAASFFLSEKAAGGSKADEQLEQKIEEKLMKKLFDEENMEAAVTKLVEAAGQREQEQAGERLLDIKGEMDQITNEKMMAFTEMSDQVLEKVHQDHTEVVFLYDMLKEKESELKDYSAKLTGVRKEVEALLQKAEKLPAAPQAEAPVHQGAALVRSAGGEEKAAAKVKKPEPIKEPEAETDKQQKERNEQILKLHREGKPVVEISKLLEMGQGEVKLVIDLFQGAE